jgi:hypothetical protein
LALVRPRHETGSVAAPIFIYSNGEERRFDASDQDLN